MSEKDDEGEHRGSDDTASPVPQCSEDTMALDYDLYSDPERVVRGVMLLRKGSIIDELFVPDDRRWGMVVFWLGELPLDVVFVTPRGNHLVRTSLTEISLRGGFEFFGLIKKELRIHVPTAAPDTMWEGDCEGDMLRYLPSNLPLPFPGGTFNDVSLSSSADEGGSGGEQDGARVSSEVSSTVSHAPPHLASPPHLSASPTAEPMAVRSPSGPGSRYTVPQRMVMEYPALPPATHDVQAITSGASSSTDGSPSRKRSTSVRVVSKQKRIARKRPHSTSIGPPGAYMSHNGGQEPHAFSAAPSRTIDAGVGSASTREPVGRDGATSGAGGASVEEDGDGVTMHLTQVVSSIKDSLDSAGGLIRELASEISGDDGK